MTSEISVERVLNYASYDGSHRQQLEYTAYCVYVKRVETGRPGGPSSDWAIAKSELDRKKIKYGRPLAKGKPI